MRSSSSARSLAVASAAIVLGTVSPVAHPEEGAASSAPAQRPVPKMNRWQEDWSALSDPSLRTEPLDDLKYIPLGSAMPEGYLSLGATLRERFESNDAAGFGVGGTAQDAYVLQRVQLHADLHINDELRLFTQLEDDEAFHKTTISSVDQDRLDLRLAFLEYVRHLSGGTLKTRLGRQDFAFDLQRFVSSRDGPNVRQAFDAAWVDWEDADWRFIGFLSRPVQYFDDHPFDDRSNNDFRFHTLRVERHVLGDNELSAYYSLYERRFAQYGDAAGSERRNIFDVRFAGKSGALDWDTEAMLQTGTVGGKEIRAWATGPSAGFTLADVVWHPRVGVQVDIASGDSQHGDGRVGTFNPLFPNGYYFSLAGYTGYANLIQVKPSVTLRPSAKATLLAGLGLQWRQTLADAVYTQPNVPVAGTAGRSGRWSGVYAQGRVDYLMTPNFTTAIEAVHYWVGDAIRSVGGHDSTFVGIEGKFAW